MAHYGTLRDYHFTDIDETTDDIRGAKVYGLNDEKLGKIDDVIFDHQLATSAMWWWIREGGFEQEVHRASLPTQPVSAARG